MTSLRTRPAVRWGAALSAAFFYALFLAVAPGFVLSDRPTADAAPTLAPDGPFPKPRSASTLQDTHPVPRDDLAQRWPDPPPPVPITDDGPSSAPALSPTCPPLQLATEALWTRWAPYELEVSTLDPDLARAVAAEINRIPPETDWAPLRVKIAEGISASAVVLEFADGCAWTSGPRPKPEIRALLQRAANTGA